MADPFHTTNPPDDGQRTARHISPYTQLLFLLAPDHDPRHIEADMRSEHGTLDHLSRDAFQAEVLMAIRCIDLAA